MTARLAEPSPRRWCVAHETSWTGPGGCPECGDRGTLSYDPPYGWPVTRPPEEPVEPTRPT